ncbi:carbonic anhydrase-related protein isoform X2 [Ahaetulla prasina]|uniref:carbonic anhydrase-related protein isoform X2 n=1 Tax=Ahaetulla prasina TaxID=499056 RepID=UPI00264875FA|nr:carbonic anhydrase-related protein isoform X2 [Ahaetulla prasina]
MDVSFLNAVNLSNGADTTSCAQAQTVPSQERRRLLNTCLFTAELPVFTQSQPSSSRRKRRLLLFSPGTQPGGEPASARRFCPERPRSAEKAGSFMEESGQVAEKEENVDWGYEEGVEWGLIFPDANGEYQSPINLNSREAKYDPLLLEVRLSPNYVVCRDCEMLNDGHSIQILLKTKSMLVGGPLPRGHEFELHNVRFHWGRENQRGSEHTVNFKAFPMELHLIHWNTTMYHSIDEAVGKKNGIAIIALFVQIGKEHSGLKAVTEILQDIQYKIEEFRGLRNHIKGAELLEGCDGNLGDNFRPTQPLNDRVIRAAFQ